MLVRFSPQRSDKQVDYEFSGEVVTATADGITDSFDFSSMLDGEIARNDDGSMAIETALPVMPIVDANRTNGFLTITLVKFHGEEATEDERFPEWREVK